MGRTSENKDKEEGRSTWTAGDSLYLEHDAGRHKHVCKTFAFIFENYMEYRIENVFFSEIPII